LPYLDKNLHLPTVIYHGRRDDVVPPEAVRIVAQQLFKNHTVNVVDDDRNLHEIFPTLDWNALRACSRITWHFTAGPQARRPGASDEVILEHAVAR